MADVRLPVADVRENKVYYLVSTRSRRNPARLISIEVVLEFPSEVSKELFEKLKDTELVIRDDTIETIKTHF